MKFLKSYCHGIDRVNDFVGRNVGYVILYFTFFIVYEVVLRYVFNSPSIWVEESVSLVFGGYVMIGAAYAHSLRAHINLDLFYRRWSPRTKAIVDIITSTIFFFFVFCLLWKGWAFAWTATQQLQVTQSVWAPYVFPTKLMIPVAAFLILLQGIANLIRDLNMAVTGRELI